jgi:hypothetical protein
MTKRTSYKFKKAIVLKTVILDKNFFSIKLKISVVVPDPDPLVRGMDPGSGIGFFRVPDLGSRIPNPYI